jgi:CrcB protein
LLIGFIAAFSDPEGRVIIGPTARQFLMTGIMGGYTTYSSFSLQTLNLARDGEWGRAAAYAFGTFVVCFVAVWLGHVGASWFNTLKHS